MAKIILKQIAKIVIVVKNYSWNIFIGNHGDRSMNLFGGQKRCCDRQ